MNENSEKYVFQFNEINAQKLSVLLRDCIGVAYYGSLTMVFFEQMERQRMNTDYLKNPLIDIALREHYTDNGGRYWHITIIAGALKLSGDLTEQDMLRFVRGEEISIRNADIFGAIKTDNGKTQMVTAENVNLRRIAL